MRWLARAMATSPVSSGCRNEFERTSVGKLRKLVEEQDTIVGQRDISWRPRKPPPTNAGHARGIYAARGTGAGCSTPRL